MHVLVTGSQGFIGKNLVVRLGEQQGFVVQRFDRGDEPYFRSVTLN
jgi:UDP-2-acetamido-2,6-beta-L-arabino-hexul-4-ose reductase